MHPALGERVGLDGPCYVYGRGPPLFQLVRTRLVIAVLKHPGLDYGEWPERLDGPAGREPFVLSRTGDVLANDLALARGKVRQAFRTIAGNRLAHRRASVLSAQRVSRPDTAERLLIEDSPRRIAANRSGHLVAGRGVGLRKLYRVADAGPTSVEIVLPLLREIRRDRETTGEQHRSEEHEKLQYVSHVCLPFAVSGHRLRSLRTLYAEIPVLLTPAPTLCAGKVSNQIDIRNGQQRV